MQCPHCQHVNNETAKFCEECGTRLARTCPACGHEVSPTAKFCPECGTALVAGPQSSVADSRSPAPNTQPPLSYTPQHLAERILADQAAMETHGPPARPPP